MERKTPLYDCHEALNAKIVPFAGYLLPIQYPTGILSEHLAVRNRAGLFDVSHMGEILVSGPDALANLNAIMTNNFATMDDGGVRYSLMCNTNGGVVDDLLVYRYTQEKYMIVVNGANREKDVEWMKTHLNGNVQLEDISDDVALIALQGPYAKEILSKLVDISKLPSKYFTFVPSLFIKHIPCIVSWTGYTGEEGFELYCSNHYAAALWSVLLEAGKEYGLIPCGLGARDTLRFEASMPLYGHELDETITPLEANLNFAVKFNKDNFIGKESLTNLQVHRKRVGLKLIDRGIAREHCKIYSLSGEELGYVTSGTYCPYLDGAYAMGLISLKDINENNTVEIDVRGKRLLAQIVSLPFYKR